MKKIAKSRLVHKITIILALIISLNFITPRYSFAGVEDIAGGLLKEVVQLFAAIGDVVMGALNHFMLGTDGVTSAMLDQQDINITEPGKGSWLTTNLDEGVQKTIDGDKMDKKTFLLDADDFKIPNMLYSPENIFANNIAMLDINFLNPNTYSSVVVSGSAKDDAKDKSVSAAKSLQPVIAGWYKAFRNISIVGLLSVLVYLGIRILISSTSTDKAKYKESLKDWAIALCLVFVIHFIMSGILMATNAFNELFSEKIDEGITIETTGSNDQPLRFKTNLTGLVRFQAQLDSWQDATAYTIIYLALVIYTVVFTVIYFKRFLWMAFFTMIAPLVALTYPIDRAGDGKAQAFNLWFKEYTMNAILQPVHLILYTVFVTSAADLAADNPLYAIVAIAFLLPAEKFIKKMFGFDKAETAGGFGSFAGGALTMKGLNMLSRLGKGKSGTSGKGSSGSSDDGSNDKIKFAKNSEAGNLSEFGSSSQSQSGDNEGTSTRRISGGQESDQRNGQQGDNNMPDDGAQLDNGGNPELDNEYNGDEEMPTFRDMLDERRTRNQLRDEINNDNIPEDEREASRQRLDQVNQRIARGNQLWKNKIGEKARGVGKFALRGAKPLGKGLKFAGKGMLRAAGAMGGATIGLAAGLTTGDMSNALSMAAGGAVAGQMIGKTAGTIPGRLTNFGKNQANSLKTIPSRVQDAWNADVHGPAYARQRQIERQNSRARHALLNDDNERRKALELAGKMGYNGPSTPMVDNILNAKADLYEQGITDDELIENTIKTEYKQEKELNGSKHNKYVQGAGFINKQKITKADIDDEKKMKSFEERVETDSSLSGNIRAQNEVMKITTGILGADKVYSQRQKEGRTRIKPVAQQPQNPQQQTPRKPKKPRTQGPNA